MSIKKRSRVNNNNKIARFLLLGLFLVLPSLLSVLLVTESSAIAETAAPLTVASNWSPAVAITDLGNTAYGATSPIVRADPESGRVMVAYNRQIDSSGSIIDPYYRFSTDHGTTWSSPAAITSTIAKSQQIHFDFDDNGIAHAVWQENNNLVYANSGNNSNYNWEGTYRTISSGSVLQLDIIASGTNTIDIVWSEGATTPNIYHARSNSSGNENPWPIQGIITSTSFLSQFPSLAVDQTSTIHVVWQESDTPIFSPPEPRLGGTIYYAKSTGINGNVVSWSPSIPITNVDDAREPKLIIDGSTLHVVYIDYHEITEQYIHYIQCNSNCTVASNWTNPVKIFDQRLGSNTKPINLVSTLAQRGSCIISYFHGIHPDNLNASSSLEYLYGNTSCSGWNSTDLSLIENEVQSINPSLAAFNDWWLYLAYEKGSGTNQIYFNRSKPNIYLPVVMK